MQHAYLSRFYNQLDDYCHPNKVLVLYGPRQAGKTSLLEHYLAHSNYRYKLDSGDNVITQNLLSSTDFATIKAYAEGYELIAIDEAQNIPNIGQCLKIMVDHIPDLRIIHVVIGQIEITKLFLE